MCVFLCIFNDQFWCILVRSCVFSVSNSCVFSMSISCVFSICAFLRIFNNQFLCVFNVCADLCLHIHRQQHTAQTAFSSRQRRLSVYLSLSFQRQTRNTSGPTGVLRSKLILFLLIFLSDQKYVWVLWSSSANRQGIDYTFIFSKKNINLLETNSSQRWILC